MAYYSGSAVSLAALRAALVSACADVGWGWDAATEVLSKDGLYLRLRTVSGDLELLGQTGVAAGAAPNVVRVGVLFSRTGYPTYGLEYPLLYEIFVFDYEVFMVVTYNVDHHQWCAFGRSSVSGLPGSGMWFGASGGPTAVTNVPGGEAPVYITPTGGGDLGNQGKNTTALFWDEGGSAYATGRNCWVHSGLDAQGWWMDQTIMGRVPGVALAAPLMTLLPNAWNSEGVLLPIRAFKARPESKISLTVDLVHARYTRIDNYVDGQILIIGPDRWKVFPWFRKNSGARNGGQGVDHTGTFGWAIRYEGP